VSREPNLAELTDQELKEQIRLLQQEPGGRLKDDLLIDVMRRELVDRLRRKDEAAPLLEPPPSPDSFGGASGVREPRRPGPASGADAIALPSPDDR